MIHDFIDPYAEVERLQEHLDSAYRLIGKQREVIDDIATRRSSQLMSMYTMKTEERIDASQSLTYRRFTMQPLNCQYDITDAEWQATKDPELLAKTICQNMADAMAHHLYNEFFGGK